MSSNVRIEVHHPGVAALLKSPGVQADLLARAQQMASRAGAGMEASPYMGRNRARASVITATFAARRREAQSRALTNAVGAGRG